ncbi:MAG: beta-N-acetylhexosaminidase [Lentisphaeria bacterium]|nr:beta-N-acetylhexosaminidase [Lentisphaeria bacterium]
MGNISLIPQVKTLQENGFVFNLSAASRIAAATAGAVKAAELLAEYLRKSTGFALPVVSEVCPGDIVLSENGLDQCDDCGFYNERYTVKVTGENIFIAGGNTAALVRGIQTLRQLFPAEVYSEKVVDCNWSVPGVEIEDEPAFRWRGIMIDVARHFFNKNEVCRMIELAAQFKVSVVHLHLTDDQGWRVEIKRYPKLTEIGSVRKRTIIGHESSRPRKYDYTPYGGFFTVEDLREIVEFAAKRAIMLVPEIDMPGHMCAAIAAYPELGNFPQHQLDVRDCWGISYQILSPRDYTVEFMQNVLNDIMDIFPGRFIHIGGDEARKDEWAISPDAQEIMARENCKNESELQSYFIRRMSEVITARGRRMIGWNEIMHGGLADGAAVMSWQDTSYGNDAAKMHHDVVMAPKTMTYLNYYQADPAHEPPAIGGDISAEMVYRFNPVCAELNEDEQKYILGGQAQMWSEYIDNIKLWEYHAFPRYCALAEKLWSPADKCYFADFVKRLNSIRKKFAVQDVNAHVLP